MTAGAPHIADTHSRSNTNATAAQAAHIRQLLDLGNTPAMVVAAVGCSYARVQQVAHSQPATVVPSPRTQPQPAKRGPKPAPRAPGATSWDAVLARAAHIDDPRIAAHLDHILADLADLLADIRLHDEREKAAQALVDADRRAALLARDYTDRHPARHATHLEDQQL